MVLSVTPNLSHFVFGGLSEEGLEKSSQVLVLFQFVSQSREEAKKGGGGLSHLVPKREEVELPLSQFRNRLEYVNHLSEALLLVQSPGRVQTGGPLSEGGRCLISFRKTLQGLPELLVLLRRGVNCADGLQLTGQGFLLLLLRLLVKDLCFPGETGANKPDRVQTVGEEQERLVRKRQSREFPRRNCEVGHESGRYPVATRFYLVPARSEKTAHFRPTCSELQQTLRLQSHMIREEGEQLALVRQLELQKIMSHHVVMTLVPGEVPRALLKRAFCLNGEA